MARGPVRGRWGVGGASSGWQGFGYRWRWLGPSGAVAGDRVRGRSGRGGDVGVGKGGVRWQLERLVAEGRGRQRGWGGGGVGGVVIRGV